MMEARSLLGLLFVGSGALLMALNVPLILGRIPPNPLYGFRVRQTLSDPAVWYEANRYCGKLGLALGAVVILTAALYFVPEIDLTSYALLVLVVLVFGLGIVLFLSFRYLQRRT